MPIEFINRREFARRDGCDEKQVRRGIKSGILSVNSDDLLDSSQVGTTWRKSNRRTFLKGESSKAAALADNMKTLSGVRMQFDDLDSSEEVAARILSATNAPHDYAEALRLKENFIAQLKQLEYEQRSGRLIDLEEAKNVVFEEFRGIRDAWLNWPAKFGAKIAADLNMEADRVVEVLTGYVNQQLVSLGEPQADFCAQSSYGEQK